MLRLLSSGLLLIGLLLPSTLWAAPQVQIKVQGSTTVNPIVAEAAELFSAQKGWRILVDTQGGSSGGIHAIANKLADIGMISKPLSEGERAKFPQIDFHVEQIAIDGLALVVSQPVWDSGVHSLKPEDIRAIYENTIRNWSAFGGFNKPIVFYNKEPGRGTWEVFAKWLYGSVSAVPLISHPEVGGNEEGRNKVSFHPSAMTQLSFAWANASAKLKVLGIENKNGAIVYPTLDTVRAGTYPISRPLQLITNGTPSGPVLEFIEFIKSEKGRELVAKYGYVPFTEL